MAGSGLAVVAVGTGTGTLTPSIGCVRMGLWADGPPNQEAAKMAQTERFERERGDFDTDLLTSAQDAGDLALMERFDAFRPLDAAFFGEWEAEAAMLFALPDGGTGSAGHIGNLFDCDSEEETS